ncbi:hypothetical protein C8R47DRAFT_398222 [Mycena vitilis]|nr:hypothetical protein C8R47DRAFT_398222 [Mycena vitilis]
MRLERASRPQGKCRAVVDPFEPLTGAGVPVVPLVCAVVHIAMRVVVVVSSSGGLRTIEPKQRLAALRACADVLGTGVLWIGVRRVRVHGAGVVCGGEGRQSLRRRRRRTVGVRGIVGGEGRQRQRRGLREPIRRAGANVRVQRDRAVELAARVNAQMGRAVYTPVDAMAAATRWQRERYAAGQRLELHAAPGRRHRGVSTPSPGGEIDGRGVQQRGRLRPLGRRALVRACARLGLVGAAYPTFLGVFASKPSRQAARTRRVIAGALRFLRQMGRTVTERGHLRLS